MLFVRRTIIVLAVFLLAVGSFQLLFKQGTVDLTRAMVESDLWMRLAAIVALFFGIVLVVAARMRVMAMAAFFQVAGLVIAAIAAVLLVYPPLFVGVVCAIFLDRSHATQMFVVQLTGLIRITIGLLLLYAVARPPRRETQSAPPPAQP